MSDSETGPDTRPLPTSPPVDLSGPRRWLGEFGRGSLPLAVRVILAFGALATAHVVGFFGAVPSGLRSVALVALGDTVLARLIYALALSGVAATIAALLPAAAVHDAVMFAERASDRLFSGPARERVGRVLDRVLDSLPSVVFVIVFGLVFNLNYLGLDVPHGLSSVIDAVDARTGGRTWLNVAIGLYAIFATWQLLGFVRSAFSAGSIRTLLDVPEPEPAGARAGSRHVRIAARIRIKVVIAMALLCSILAGHARMAGLMEIAPLVVLDDRLLGRYRVVATDGDTSLLYERRGDHTRFILRTPTALYHQVVFAPGEAPFCYGRPDTYLERFDVGVDDIDDVIIETAGGPCADVEPSSNTGPVGEGDPAPGGPF